MSRRKAGADVGAAGDVYITWKRAIVQKFTGRSGDELERWPERTLDHILHVMINDGFLEQDGTVHKACLNCGHSMKFHQEIGSTDVFICTKTEELYGKHIYCECKEAVSA